MNKIFSCFIFIILLSCNVENRVSKKFRSKSENILNYEGSPNSIRDKSMLMFSDQGAWFAYSLPDTSSCYGGFSGPFLMTQQNGVWSSSVLSQLHLFNDKKEIQWENSRSTSYNSHLEQVYSNTQFSLEQQLVFSSGHTALIRSKITNLSKEPVSLSIQWNNRPILADGLSVTSHKNKVTITSSKSNAVGHLIFPEDLIIDSDSLNYQSRMESITLQANESKEIVISHSFIFPEYSWEKEQSDLRTTTFDRILDKRKIEKEKQLSSLVKSLKPQFKDTIYEQLLAKSALTLQNNWRIPAGELKHEGLFPSYHYKWFHGFWSWDSWKHAVGLSHYDSKLAKNQMRAMFDFQREDGFIVDCVYRDTTIEAHNYRDTKPPLAAWAVAKIYAKDSDSSFVEEFYPKLKKYHEWWYNQRDHDKDGLCEYGSTDGTVLAAKWESGMDNAIRFDDSKILKNKEGAYSIDQESVDLNAYLYAEKLYLASLAEAISKLDDRLKYLQEAKALKSKIQKQFFDVEDGWFYDTNLDGTKFIKGEGSEGWTPLWAKVASQKQAEAVKNNMMNPNKFYSKVPFQTMSADHPKFDPMNGYWRGPNWLDQAYFGVKGIRNYGFNSEADSATIQIINGARGLLEKGMSIRENYHPLTGEGRNAKNFSWSAAHLIMLLVDEQE